MVYDVKMGTKEKLVEAAGRCLLEKGSHAASVKAIASMAGVNHGLVHHYFGSKEGLFIELVKNHFNAITPAPDRSLNTTEELINYLAEIVVVNSRMMIELRALSFHMPELDSALILMSKEFRGRIKSILHIDEDSAILLQGAVVGLGFTSSLDNSIEIKKHLNMILGIVKDK